MAILQLNHVSKYYGKVQAINDISLELEPGMFGLLGPNGAGKTTLMRILTTVIPPSSGRINFELTDWSNPEEVRSIMGYLPQKFSLYKHIKVGEALNHIALLKGIVAERDKKVNSVMEQVNIAQIKNKKIGELSGGMVRRVGIAQAILGEPRIIVVDEPTAGLDPEERIRFRRLLHQLGKDKIIIISTHIVEDIEATCEKAAVLHMGKILAQGEVSSLSAFACGKVWKVSVPRRDYYDLSEKWKVVASQLIDDIYQLRILSDSRPEGAEPIAPSLEDGYLYLMECAS